MTPPLGGKRRERKRLATPQQRFVRDLLQSEAFTLPIEELFRRERMARADPTGWYFGLPLELFTRWSGPDPAPR